MKALNLGADTLQQGGDITNQERPVDAKRTTPAFLGNFLKNVPSLL